MNVLRYFALMLLLPAGAVRPSARAADEAPPAPAENVSNPQPAQFFEAVLSVEGMT